jgi:hypothetical protein
MNYQNSSSIIIGNLQYNIGNVYYIAGSQGKNLLNYPRLTSLIDALIDQFGNSTKYPNHYFNFELFEDNNFDSGLANIYKLTITMKDNSIITMKDNSIITMKDKFKNGDRFRITLNNNIEYGTVLHRRKMYGDAYGGTYMVEYDNPKIKNHNNCGDSMELL